VLGVLGFAHTEAAQVGVTHRRHPFDRPYAFAGVERFQVPGQSGELRRFENVGPG
jgi:hypothetical protein